MSRGLAECELKPLEIKGSQLRHDCDIRSRLKHCEASSMRWRQTDIYGAPEEIRTPDPQIRSLADSVDYTDLFCKPQAETAKTLLPAVNQAANSAGLESLAPQNRIAKKLLAHFAAQGSVADAVMLVDRLESELLTKRKASNRGTRLALDWCLTSSDRSYAQSRGMSRARVDDEAEKFRNYWTAKTGASASKRDWSATWRNWIITAMERDDGRARGFGAPGRRPAGSNTILAGMARLARKLDE
jgi:hypothetical protein